MVSLAATVADAGAVLAGHWNLFARHLMASYTQMISEYVPPQMPRPVAVGVIDDVIDFVFDRLALNWLGKISVGDF